MKDALKKSEGKSPRLVKHEEWITIPSPPSINQKYISRTFVLNPEYRNFKNEVAAICIREKVKKFIGEVDVKIKWYRPAKRGDVDGIVKPIFDGMTMGGIWEDDKQVSSFSVIRDDSDRANARAVIQVKGKIEGR